MEHGDFEFDPRRVVDWREQYNVPYGKDKVDARQRVYGCTEENRPPVNYDQEVIRVVAELATSKYLSFVDVGCSRPDLLEKLDDEGYEGMKFGIDPNSRQFGKRPYWSPLNENLLQIDSDDIWTPGNHPNKNTLLFDYKKQNPDVEAHKNIYLIEAIANRIPLPNNFADVIFEMFSLYHVDQIDDAVIEFMRLLKFGGYNIMTLSGNDNKAWMHQGQNDIAAQLSENLKKRVLPPPPLHSGFTVEDAEVLLPKYFAHNKARYIEENLVFDTPERVHICLMAHMTQADQYKSLLGRTVPTEEFLSAMESTVEKQLRRGLKTNSPMTDKASRAIIVSSQNGFEVDELYVQIKK